MQAWLVVANELSILEQVTTRPRSNWKWPCKHAGTTHGSIPVSSQHATVDRRKSQDSSFCRNVQHLLGNRDQFIAKWAGIRVMFHNPSSEGATCWKPMDVSVPVNPCREDGHAQFSRNVLGTHPFFWFYYSKIYNTIIVANRYSVVMYIFSSNVRRLVGKEYLTKKIMWNCRYSSTPV